MPGLFSILRQGGCRTVFLARTRCFSFMVSICFLFRFCILCSQTWPLFTSGTSSIIFLSIIFSRIRYQSIHLEKKQVHLQVFLYHKINRIFLYGNCLQCLTPVTTGPGILPYLRIQIPSHMPLSFNFVLKNGANISISHLSVVTASLRLMHCLSELLR